MGSELRRARVHWRCTRLAWCRQGTRRKRRASLVTRARCTDAQGAEAHRRLGGPARAAPCTPMCCGAAPTPVGHRDARSASSAVRCWPSCQPLPPGKYEIGKVLCQGRRDRARCSRGWAFDFAPVRSRRRVSQTAARGSPRGRMVAAGAAGRAAGCGSAPPVPLGRRRAAAAAHPRRGRRQSRSAQGPRKIAASIHRTPPARAAARAT